MENQTKTNLKKATPGFSLTELIVMIVLIGIFGVIGQIGLTLSYQLSKASYVAPYSYFYIIFSGLIGFYIWVVMKLY